MLECRSSRTTITRISGNLSAGLLFCPYEGPTPLVHLTSQAPLCVIGQVLGDVPYKSVLMRESIASYPRTISRLLGFSRGDGQLGEIKLSDRQILVAEYVGRGYCNRDIAAELKVTEQVVKNIVHSLFDRLGVWNRVELTNYFSKESPPDVVHSAQVRVEADRLAEVRRLSLLDTSAERIFDEIASIAATAFQVPIALVALADSDRIWFKSCIGLTAVQVPREITLCHHTIKQSEVFVVEDASKDARFAHSPLVCFSPEVRFYAAAPILTEDGYALGVVCVVDRIPRHFSSAQIAILKSLAHVVLEQVQLKMQLVDLTPTNSLRGPKAVQQAHAEVRPSASTLIEN